MPSRRALLLSVPAIAAAGGAGYLFQANHSIPPADPLAEERFRELQALAMAHYGLAGVSRHLPLADSSLNVHAIDAGQGDPVLFLHGGNSVAAGWIPLLALLSDRYRTLAPDRPGCGLTTKLDYSGVPFRAHAVEFVRDVMDALGLEVASLVGNSMGGYFALVFALAEPERVSKLVLVGEPAGSAPEIRVANRLVGTRIVNSALFATVLKPGDTAMRNSLANMLVAHPERVPQELVDCLTAGSVIPGAKESWITMNENMFEPRGVGLFSPRSMLSYSLRPELGSLRPSTLLLWGDKDTFGPPSLGEEMAALMPDARCRVVADAGHLPWLDYPERCAEEIHSFFSG